MVDTQAIERSLREAFAFVSESLSAAGYPERVRDAYELLEANEPAVALENMCSNLHEFGCRIPARAYDIFAEAGAKLGVDSGYWEILKPQVVA
jgi:hypothetical protein